MIIIKDTITTLEIHLVYVHRVESPKAILITRGNLVRGPGYGPIKSI
jgi:hypothetical protein